MNIKHKMTAAFMLSIFFSINVFAQDGTVTVSGTVRDFKTKETVVFANVAVFVLPDSTFIAGTVTNDEGRFSFKGLKQGDYTLQISYLGYKVKYLDFRAGRLSPFLDMGTIYIEESVEELGEVLITGRRDEITGDLDRKTFAMDANISQLGGSVLQAMASLPGVTVDQEGKIQIRGSDRVAVLIDGKQTAITGFGTQTGLGDIPASAVESIEIINNPSARYDANGMAGIINIKFKKEQQKGWSGRAGMNAGLGSLGIKRENTPGIRDQYRFTPKINPSASVNYRQNDLNFFLQSDVLWHQLITRNEFIERSYDDGTVIRQQFLENRTQPIINVKTGVDWYANERNSFTFSALYNLRAYTDLGDLPYDNAETGVRQRLWQYREYEANQTLLVSINHKHKFKQPGHQLDNTLNYSFRRKDEVFNFFDDRMGFLGTDSTALIADEHVVDYTLDYIRPHKAGRWELGTKQRTRIFPNHITFTPGINSILDPNLQGDAEYREFLTAYYGTYVFESKRFEIEAGLRAEYAAVDYLVDQRHPVYESDGFTYFALFPNVRIAWLADEVSNLSVFYNRRVDRPEESALRAFPTYADPEILVIGNPGLLPMFTQTVEVGYKRSHSRGYIYAALYHRFMEDIITRIITSRPDGSLLVSIPQNAGRGSNSGMEFVYTQAIGKAWDFQFNSNFYLNRIDAFETVTVYPEQVLYLGEAQESWSGNAKLNIKYKAFQDTEIQLTGIYLAPDIVPQGRIADRYSIDMGIKKMIQKGKGELFMNATDIFNTMRIKYNLRGNDFDYVATDFFETQAVRVGYLYRF